MGHQEIGLKPDGGSSNQGNPSSPLLFIVVADTLSRILSNNGLGGIDFSCIGLFPNDWQCSMHAICGSCQDAEVYFVLFWDDYGLENKLRQNTILVGLNLTVLETANLSKIIGRQTSELPIRYLGIPLHHGTLKTKDWNFMLEKVDKKLAGWKGKVLTKAGRLTSINTVLRAIQRIPVAIIKKINIACRRFFWGHHNNQTRKPLCLASWGQVFRPIKLGGLGIADLGTLNRSLLLKW